MPSLLNKPGLSLLGGVVGTVGLQVGASQWMWLQLLACQVVFSVVLLLFVALVLLGFPVVDLVERQPQADQNPLQTNLSQCIYYQFPACRLSMLLLPTAELHLSRLHTS